MPLAGDAVIAAESAVLEPVDGTSALFLWAPATAVTRTHIPRGAHLPRLGKQHRHWDSRTVVDVGTQYSGAFDGLPLLVRLIVC
jgi:hypothetical protein